MNNAKTIEVTIERTIPTSPGEAFDAWLNPKIPGNPWNMAEKAPVESNSRRVLLLGRQGDTPLRALHRGRAARSNSAYLDVTEYFRTGVDGNRDL